MPTYLSLKKRPKEGENAVLDKYLIVDKQIGSAHCLQITVRVKDIPIIAGAHKASWQIQST